MPTPNLILRLLQHVLGDRPVPIPQLGAVCRIGRRARFADVDLAFELFEGREVEDRWDGVQAVSLLVRVVCES